ncbi:MAG: RHS repeat-associated core domain-containing protein, partial [Deltaproteobacteria bacterium]
MAELMSRARSAVRRLAVRVARLIALAVVMAVILAIGAAAADYFVPRDQPPSARRDTNDRLESVETGTGEVKLYRYHPSGLLTEVAYARRGRFSDVLYPATRTTRVRLDPALRRTALEDETGRTAFTFDELGQLAGVTDPDGRKLGYTRGPWGEIRTIDLPDRQQLRYRYDARLRPTRVSDGDAAITYEYRDDQHEVIRRLPGGVTTLIRRDAHGAVAVIRHTRADQVLLELRYRRDDDGRVIRREEDSALGTRVWEFHYDPLGRLVRETEPGGPVELAYDADGNLTSRSDASHVTRFAYEQGQLVRESRYDRRGQDLDLVDEIAFEYDRRGQLHRQHGRKRVITYDWNADGQLVDVQRSDGTVHYTYNGDGLRVARKFHGKRTEYLHHLDGPLPEVIVERDPDGRLAHDILGLGRVGRSGPDGAHRFYLEDELGSTRVVVDDRGQPVARYEYSEFGVPTRVDGSAEAPYLFTGQPWDPDTELLFLRNRYYAPAIARFLSPDPHPPTLADPQSLNRYSYCEGDPINKIDPTGLQPWVPPPPPPPPPPFYDPNEQLWRLLSLHRDYLPFQLFQPPALPPPPVYNPTPEFWRMPSLPSFQSLIPTGMLPMNYSTNPLPDIPGWVDRTQTAFDIADNLRTLSWFPPISAEAEHLFDRIGRVSNIVTGVEIGYNWARGKRLDAATKGVDLTLSIVVPVAAPEVAVPVALTWIALSFVPKEDRDAMARAVVASGWSELRNGNVAGFLTTPLTLAQSAVARAVASSELRIDRRDRSFDMPLRGPESGLGSTRQGFFPPGPPGGPGGALPGGVYFDQTAKVLGDLGAITGAVFDRASGRLVLVGDHSTALPPIKPQILAAAIRAVYSPCHEAPGMTIDPHPENPRGPVMLVRFFCTDHTELGQVMFESDRLLKGYSVGTDNVTKARVTSSVPGYRSVTERGLDGGARNELWSRFWIVPEPVTAKVSDQGILFDPIRLRVKTETMRFEGGKLVSAGGAKDPVAEDFAAHFTEHYAEFAKEQPAFAELETVAQAVALARWLKDSGVPADWGFVASVLAEPYPTPTTTPSA